MINKDTLDVIKCEMDNNTLVVKSTVENFNAKSQLIVNESQEALFYKDGQALDLFASGRHSLNSDNLPFFKRIFASLFGGKTPFSCEVFYINKVSVLDMVWGTNSPITVEDPKYNIIIDVKASGQTGVKVKDSRKFVVKVVGQLHEYSVSSVSRAIKGAMMSSIKETIAMAIVNKGISILEISTQLSSLSADMVANLNARLDDLGIELTHFYVDTIVASEDDLAKLRDVRAEVEAESYKLRKLSEARAYARNVEGYTYQEERKYDVLENAASNSGTGGTLINAGLGLGVGLGVMNEVNRVTNTSLSAQQSAEQPSQGRACAQCGTVAPQGAKFCPGCGSPINQAKFCTNCGTKLDPAAKFCLECGTKVQ
ncbi:MAG: SPFH domain-containing protein [Ruminococcaceae bacterium]|nr:SPFH domain-containing protein [Oscillospiraceae bacterium]